MAVTIKIDGETFERLNAERKKYLQTMEERGAEEGLAWAGSVGYVQLLEMKNNFYEWYGVNGPGLYCGHDVANTPPFNDYWGGVFERNPDVAKAANIGCSDCWMNEEANSYFDSWINAVRMFCLALERWIEERENESLTGLKDDLPF